MKKSAEKQVHQLYLIYGNNETKVQNARYELVTSLLSPEERDAGLTEIQSAGNQALTLDTSLNEIVEELGTTSFIGDSRRVVVVYDLRDLMSVKASRGGAKKGKAKTKKSEGPTRMEVLLRWFDEVLPTTENIAIFVVTENDEKQRKIDPESPLFRYIKQHGKLIEEREKALNFDFEDHLINGNGPAALMVLREWMRRGGSDSGSRMKIYTTIANVVEMAIQARCLHDGRDRGVPRGHLEVPAFPSLGRIPDWKAKKFHRMAQRFTFAQLKKLTADLNHLQRIMYPTGNEDYVPNWEDYTEVIVMELTMGTTGNG